MNINKLKSYFESSSNIISEELVVNNNVRELLEQEIKKQTGFDVEFNSKLYYFVKSKKELSDKDKNAINNVIGNFFASLFK